MTPGGVATFANAPLSQLIATQGTFAFLLFLTLIYYLSQSWVPAINDTIEALPSGSRVADGKLRIPVTNPIYFTQNRLVGIMWASNDAPGQGSDIQVRLMPDEIQISALFGILSLPYPSPIDQALDRDTLSPPWGAWRPVIIATVAGLLTGGVWLSWAVLAAIYAWPIRVAVYFRDKQTSHHGCWKLCSAALLPGGLLLTASILFYTLGKIPVAGLAIAFGIHFVMGWSYVFCGAVALPLLPEAAQTESNPFNKTPKQNKDTKNPFKK